MTGIGTDNSTPTPTQVPLPQLISDFLEKSVVWDINLFVYISKVL